MSYLLGNFPFREKKKSRFPHPALGLIHQDPWFWPMENPTHRTPRSHGSLGISIRRGILLSATRSSLPAHAKISLKFSTIHTIPLQDMQVNHGIQFFTCHFHLLRSFQTSSTELVSNKALMAWCCTSEESSRWHWKRFCRGGKSLVKVAHHLTQGYHHGIFSLNRTKRSQEPFSEEYIDIHNISFYAKLAFHHLKNRLV